MTPRRALRFGCFFVLSLLELMASGAQVLFVIFAWLSPFLLALAALGRLTHGG